MARFSIVPTALLALTALINPAQGQTQQMTVYVELVQDEHKLFETSEDTKSADVKVPPNCRMVEFDPNHLEQQWAVISAAHCSNKRFELIRDEHFPIPIGIRVICDLKSGRRVTSGEAG